LDENELCGEKYFEFSVCSYVDTSNALVHEKMRQNKRILVYQNGKFVSPFINIFVLIQ
jgi:hypothetical protein